MNRDKTTCLNNHPFDLANTRITPTGSRVCRACRREAWRRKYALDPTPFIHTVNLWQKTHRTTAERREFHLRGKYGITSIEYDQLRVIQNGACALCFRTDRKLGVDHNHQTGKVRGLLCNSCNTALGAMNDDPDRLQNAIQYLKKGVA